MKKLILHLSFGILVLLVLSYCTNSKDNKQDVKTKGILSNTGNYSFNTQIDSLLRLFIHKSKCKNCYYEMCIAKREEEMLISLRASLNYPKNFNSNKALMIDLLTKKRPMLYVEIDSTIVFVYTGIEDIITPNSFYDGFGIKKTNSSQYEYTWVIEKLKNKYTVYEDTWFDPYMKEFRGVIKLEAPIIDSNVRKEKSSAE